MTESPLPYREDPQSSKGAAGSTAVPASPFRAPSAAQRSDRERGPSLHLSGQQELFTREHGQYRVTGQVSELVTLGKAVLHLPRARMCKPERRKPFLTEWGGGGSEQGRALGKWLPEVKSEFRTQPLVWRGLRLWKDKIITNKIKEAGSFLSHPLEQRATSPNRYSLPSQGPLLTPQKGWHPSGRKRKRDVPVISFWPSSQ